MTFVIVVSQPSQLYELECVKLVVLDEAAVLPASFLIAPEMEELSYNTRGDMGGGGREGESRSQKQHKNCRYATRRTIIPTDTDTHSKHNMPRARVREVERKRKRSGVKIEPLADGAGASSAAGAGRGGAREGPGSDSGSGASHSGPPPAKRARVTVEKGTYSSSHVARRYAPSHSKSLVYSNVVFLSERNKVLWCARHLFALQKDTGQRTVRTRFSSTVCVDNDRRRGRAASKASSSARASRLK